MNRDLLFNNNIVIPNRLVFVQLDNIDIYKIYPNVV